MEARQRRRHPLSTRRRGCHRRLGAPRQPRRLPRRRALLLNSESQQDPFATNVTITRTAFADNHADNAYNIADDIYIWRKNNLVAVPCPAPGKGCDTHDGTTRCCFDGGYESLTVTLPNN